MLLQSAETLVWLPLFQQRLVRGLTNSADACTLYEYTESPYLTHSISPFPYFFLLFLVFLYLFRLLPFFAPAFASCSDAAPTYVDSDTCPRAKIIVDFFCADTSSLRGILMRCTSNAMHVVPKIATERPLDSNDAYNLCRLIIFVYHYLLLPNRHI